MSSIYNTFFVLLKWAKLCLPRSQWQRKTTTARLDSVSCDTWPSVFGTRDYAFKIILDTLNCCSWIHNKTMFVKQGLVILRFKIPLVRWNQSQNYWKYNPALLRSKLINTHYKRSLKSALYVLNISFDSLEMEHTFIPSGRVWIPIHELRSLHFTVAEIQFGKDFLLNHI